MWVICNGNVDLYIFYKTRCKVSKWVGGEECDLARVDKQKKVKKVKPTEPTKANSLESSHYIFGHYNIGVT